MMGKARRSPRSGAFTLVELLVVLTIVVLVSAAVLPAILPLLSSRDMDEATRLVQATLAGIRDAAIRANEPRGMRLMTDPVLTLPPPATATGMTSGGSSVITPGAVSNAGTRMLTYNRMIAIEPAGDYKEGHVTLSGVDPRYPIPVPGSMNTITTTSPPVATTYGWTTPNGTNMPPVYPWNNPGLVESAGGVTYCYPISPSSSSRVLMIEQELFGGISGNPGSGGAPTASLPSYTIGTNYLPNPPTSWYWNLRIGDKIRISEAGRYYTIVGPMTTPNPELFVNVGAPGTTSPLSRTWFYNTGNTPPGQVQGNPEFLFVVNGQDDDGDGYVDNGWNGIDDNIAYELNNNTGSLIDEIQEWTEAEKFLGASVGAVDQLYEVVRRPVPTEGAREVALPPNIVIDATSWNVDLERSRLPIDPFSLNVDIMMDPAGNVIPTTVYSQPVVPNLSGLQTSFFHFWLASRVDVHEVGEMWGYSTTGAPVANTNSGQVNYLPMPAGTPNYSPPNPALVLSGERRLITLFTRNGLLNSDTIENFDGSNINLPFLDAQLGMREAK